MLTRLRSSALVAEEWKAAALLLLPASLGLLIFAAFPIAQAFQISFYDAPLLGEQREFVALANYRTALQDPEFQRALLNTVLYTIAVVVLQVVLALLLATLINHAFPGVGLFRSAYFLPVITSLVVVSTVWKIITTDNA